MKKRLTYALFLLLGLSLGSCGGTSSATSSESIDPSDSISESLPDDSSEIDSEDESSIEPESSETSSEVSSETSSEPVSSSEEPVGMQAEIIISDFNDPLIVKNTIVEGTGAYRLTVEVTDLPTGMTIDDCVFDWPNNNAFAAFEGEAPWGVNTKQYVVNYAGMHDFKVEVTCGSESVVAEKSMEITKNASLYQLIDEPSEFIDMLSVANNTNRYELGANLDLGGYAHDGVAANVTFNGLIDGMGYTVSNFKVHSAATNVNAGLFRIMARGLVRNIHLVGQVDASVGWSGLLAGEVGNLSVVEDSLFEAENISVCADWTWQRNGVIAGVFKGLVRNIVSIKTGDDQMIGTIPYGYNNGSDAFASMYNVYTNVPASIAKTFDASGSHEWGMIGSEGVEVFSDFGDFTGSTSADFALNPAIWTLADGAMPHLAHFGETALTMGPEVEASVSKSSILVAEVATVTATLKNSEEVPTWSFVASEGYASVATIVQDSVEANKFNVTGVALGTITVKIVATIGGVDYESSELTFNVIEEGSYEIPTDAVEISTYAEFIAFFDGSAANTTKNAVLTADIIGDNTLRGFGMAGEYSGIFEGQGHTISNYKTSQGLFNILGATAEVRNVNFELNHTGSGFGTIAYQNNGLISNCQITVTIDGAQNTFGGVTLVGTSGTFVDCHVSFIINNSQCKTLYPICQNDGTVDITNCSYSFAGSDGSASMFMTTNTNVILAV